MVVHEWRCKEWRFKPHASPPLSLAFETARLHPLPADAQLQSIPVEDAANPVLFWHSTAVAHAALQFRKRRRSLRYRFHSRRSVPLQDSSIRGNVSGKEVIVGHFNSSSSCVTLRQWATVSRRGVWVLLIHSFSLLGLIRQVYAGEFDLNGVPSPVPKRRSHGIASFG
jgi:hypothetical protein